MADAARATISDIAKPITTVSLRTMAFVLSLTTTLVRLSTAVRSVTESTLASRARRVKVDTLENFVCSSTTKLVGGSTRVVRRAACFVDRPRSPKPPGSLLRVLSKSKKFQYNGRSRMGRGGRRPGAGRPSRPLAEHVLRGTHRGDRHGPKVLTLPAPAPAPGWTPNEADRARLSPGRAGGSARYWKPTSSISLSGLRLLEALDTLSRLELLEAHGSSPALTREAKLFLSQWGALAFEK